MAVRVLDARPEAYKHFPDNGMYRWLELHDRGNIYGHAATADRDEAMEMHISLNQWGPGTIRQLAGDFEWLKMDAKNMGKSKIIGIRANDRGKFDAKLFRFARLFGFSEFCVYQTAAIILD